MSILKFLGFGKAEQSGNDKGSQTETVRKIVKELDQMEPEKAKYVASFAYLLSRVAHADLDISDEETREMERIVMQQGGLEESQALIVVQMAKTRALRPGFDEILVPGEQEARRTATKAENGVPIDDVVLADLQAHRGLMIRQSLNNEVIRHMRKMLAHERLHFVYRHIQRHDACHQQPH